MSVLAFDENIMGQIRNVVAYAKGNIYELDDVLDMMNGQMDVPGKKSEHLVLVPFGRWICYYLVDHSEHGLCHYFSIKSDASGKLPNKPVMECVMKEFGIERPLLDKYISIDKKMAQVNIILPI